MGILGFKRSKGLSVYSRVLSSIRLDGTLARDFVLSEDAVGRDYGWMHTKSWTSFQPECECISEELDKAVKKLLSKNTEEGKSGLISFAQKCENIMHYKKQLTELFSQRTVDKIGVKILYYTASYLICKSSKVEGVKLGLILHILVNMHTSAEDREAIKALALCGELSMLATEVISTWENGNEEIFQLAKRTHGWARVAAVARLSPNTGEIKRWMLENAVVNNVGVSILAGYVLEKLSFFEALSASEGLDRVKVEVCGRLIRAMLDGREPQEVLDIKNGNKLLDKYTVVAQECEGSAEIYSAVAAIFRYTDGSFEKLSGTVHDRCREILHSQSCVSLASEYLAVGAGLDWVSLCGLECDWKIFELIKQNYSKNIHLIENVSKIEAIEEILNLSRKELGILENEDWRPENYTQTEILKDIVGSLLNYTAVGEDFLYFALCERDTDCRTTALGVVKHWRGRGYIYLPPSVKRI